jgi:pantoate--beta-alanine ligase
MDVEQTIEGIRSRVADARKAGKTVGLVPTMGALHAGHHALIAAGRRGCDYLVVSIFVNPTQFGPGEDYEAYPRTPEEDLAACERLGTDAVFAPSAEEMYAETPRTTVHVAHLTDTLCGRRRPGHFDGVCTVVAKLLNIVRPDTAWFGQKDYQQSVVARRMVRDLNLPVSIAVCPTVREEDGLAVSSRNAYLTPNQRRQAPALYAALRKAEETIRRDRPPAEDVITAVRDHLRAQAPEGQVDYVQIVDPETLADVETTDRPVVVALAVRLGKARLIDNVKVDGPTGST